MPPTSSAAAAAAGLQFAQVMVGDRLRPVHVVHVPEIQSHSTSSDHTSAQVLHSTCMRAWWPVGSPTDHYYRTAKVRTRGSPAARRPCTKALSQFLCAILCAENGPPMGILHTGASTAFPQPEPGCYWAFWTAGGWSISHGVWKQLGLSPLLPLLQPCCCFVKSVQDGLEGNVIKLRFTVNLDEALWPLRRAASVGWPAQ
mmetsp:Transcript_78414/g.130869  ORF Transcript_78414/g.130869 Transcript_78414/m.130869 type:complete len:200 (-) Transcript_78414:88-687(-)